MNKRKLSSAFTLIELLTVIAIIVILAGLLIPTIKSAMTKAEVSKAQAAISSLSTALRSYYTEYGHWPIAYPAAPPAQYEDFIVDKDMVDLLSGDDVGASTLHPTPPQAKYDSNQNGNYQPSNATVQRNPRKIVFLEFKAKDLDSSGYFVDPWGKPYHFHLDVSYQNEVDYPFTDPGSLADKRTLPGIGFLIWSAGPDGQYNRNDKLASVSPLAYESQDSKNKDNVRSW